MSGAASDLRDERGARCLLDDTGYCFAIEFARGDAIRGTFGPLSTAQLVGVAVVVGCALVARLRLRATAAAPPTSASPDPPAPTATAD